MKYNKEEAFKRLKIPEDLSKRVFVINIPRWISWLLLKTKLVNKVFAGWYGSWFNWVLLFAGPDQGYNDMALAHEILGHRSQFYKEGKQTITNAESYAIEQGLIAIKRLYPYVFKHYYDRIKEYQKNGTKGLIQKIFQHIYFKNVNIKKLEKA